MNFAIFNKENEKSEKLKEQIKERLLLSRLNIDEENPDVVIVIGGDGTFLKAVHHYMNKLDKVSFIGLRSGSLGFYYDFVMDDIDAFILSLKENDFTTSKHHLLECDINGNIIYALNEVRFENPFHTFACEVFINEEKLEKYQGSGLLVCNELGSTAYNKSLGGAVISNDLPLLQLTEIATIQNNVYHSLGSSLVLPNDTVLSFKGDFNKTVIGYDHLTIDSNHAETIRVYASKKTITLLKPLNSSYIKTLTRSFVK